jgi:hypothetical protein
VHLDDPEDDVLEFPAYAMFLDPGTALVVRSNGNVSKKMSAGMCAKEVREIKAKSDGHILDTNMVRFNIAKNPALMNHISKGFFDVKRIGLAEFVKGCGTIEENGFWSSDTGSEDDKEITDLLDSELEDLNLDDIVCVQDDESWDPITKADPRVWMTIV